MLECCQTCGVGSLVFMSASIVVSAAAAASRPQPQGSRHKSGSVSSVSSSGGGGGGGTDDVGGVDVDPEYLCDENVPLVTSRESKAAHAIAMAETEVLKARSVSVSCPIDHKSGPASVPGGALGGGGVCRPTSLPAWTNW